MKEYLKVGSAFDDGIGFSVRHSNEQVRIGTHAINSHDELVEMNKELLAALEAVANCGRGSSGRIILDDFDEQCLVNAIAKAKGGAA